MKGYLWIIAATGVLLGILLAFQFRITREIERAEAMQNITDLAAEISLMQKDQEVLQNQITMLRLQLDNVTPLSSEFREEFEIAKVEAGVSELTGPGVEITLNDSAGVVRPGENPNLGLLHDEDILLVLNELRAAGAEAISINEQRVLATTEIRCVGPSILFNQSKRLTPPYVILAIGNPDSLEAAMKMKGGVMQNLQIFGIKVAVKKMPQVIVPAYNGVSVFEYAQAVG